MPVALSLGFDKHEIQLVKSRDHVPVEEHVTLFTPLLHPITKGQIGITVFELEGFFLAVGEGS